MSGKTVEVVADIDCECPECASRMVVVNSGPYGPYIRCFNPDCFDGDAVSPPKYRRPKITLEVLED